MQVEDRVEVLLSLVQNFDMFAWNPYEVPGVDPAFITHKLNVDPLVLQKKQKPRRCEATYGSREGGSREIEVGRGY